jgi:hypothetical protein
MTKTMRPRASAPLMLQARTSWAAIKPTFVAQSMMSRKRQERTCG